MLDYVKDMNQAERMTCVWLSILTVSIFYVVCAWLAAGNVHVDCADGSGFDSTTDSTVSLPVDHKLAFVLVWHSFLVISFAVGGTYVMKKKRTSLGVGLVVGAAIVMANFTFCVSIMEGSEVRQKNKLTKLCQLEEPLGTASDSAVIFLGIVLTILYSAIGAMLFQSKEELFGEESLIGNEGGTGYPAQAFERVPTEADVTEA
uniref:Uncharacterized protein n=1 Tax=Aplanochytrium stocchinoi TaxID=215587 RepID=A0A7S3PG66_9STRA|mmetsp:Transcript_24343/g.29712  ORF Transcript_24343/g.29712 Transcript_24343/m.29712 type:complete len:203 (+) Transcript_24343:358-966(+)